MRSLYAWLRIKDHLQIFVKKNHKLTSLIIKAGYYIDRLNG